MTKSAALGVLEQIEVEASRCLWGEKGERWLFDPNQRLDRRAPIDLISSDPQTVWYTLLADARPSFEGT